MKKHHALIACMLILTGCSTATPAFEASHSSTAAASSVPAKSETPSPTAISEDEEFLSKLTGDVLGSVQLVSFEDVNYNGKQFRHITFTITANNSQIIYTPVAWKAYRGTTELTERGFTDDAAEAMKSLAPDHVGSTLVDTGQKQTFDVYLDIAGADRIGIRPVAAGQELKYSI